MQHISSARMEIDLLLLVTNALGRRLFEEIDRPIEREADPQINVDSSRRHVGFLPAPAAAAATPSASLIEPSLDCESDRELEFKLGKFKFQNPERGGFVSR